jgi:zinc finger protein
LIIPEIDLELSAGTLGGRFTTVEGLITQVKEELSSNRRMFTSGDSVSEDRKSAFQVFLKKMDQLISLEIKPWTLILDDPISNSYIQNYYAPDPDPNMSIDIYERTFDQNEDLGLNDIKVDHYQELDSVNDVSES